MSEVSCYHWGKKGHYAENCPEKDVKQGDVHTQVIESDAKDEEADELGYVHPQNLPGLDWRTYLFIDSESSVNIFNNADLLTRSH